MSVATATYRDLALDIVRMIRAFKVRNVEKYNNNTEVVYIKGGIPLSCIYGYIHLRHHSPSHDKEKRSVCSLFLSPNPINDEDGDCLCERIHFIAIDIDIDIDDDDDDDDIDDDDIDDEDEDEDGLSYEEEYLIVRRRREDHKYWDGIADSIEKFLEENQVRLIRCSDEFFLGRAEHPEYFAHRIKKQDISRHK